MTWKSHTAIAAAITLPFNPALIPAAALGATAPDWLEWIVKFFGIRVEHRKETHYLIIPIIIIIISFFMDFRGIIFWFGIGYLTHWVADSLTITGVPIAPYARYRIHLLGGKIRTGDITEYIISFSLLLLSFIMFKPNIATANNNIFNPYNMNYKELNKKKIIDNKTMLENRFKLF